MELDFTDEIFIDYRGLWIAYVYIYGKFDLDNSYDIRSNHT